MQNLIFKGLNGHLKIAAATQYITRIKDSTKKELYIAHLYLEVFDCIQIGSKCSIGWDSPSNIIELLLPNYTQEKIHFACTILTIYKSIWGAQTSAVAYK